MTKQSPVYATDARDATLRYLRDPLNMRVLRQRLAVEGIFPAYAQAVRAAYPSLPRTFEADVVDMVRRALRAQTPRVVKRVRAA